MGPHSIHLPEASVVGHLQGQPLLARVRTNSESGQNDSRLASFFQDAHSNPPSYSRQQGV